MARALIREGRPGDAEAIARIADDVAAMHARLDPKHYSPADFDELSRAYAARAAEETAVAATLVAEDEGTLLGFAEVRLVRQPRGASGATYRPKTAALIASLAVDGAARGRGVGTELVRAAEAWAVQRGAEVVLIDVHAANEPAIAFLSERLGYAARGVILGRMLTGSPYGG